MRYRNWPGEISVAQVSLRKLREVSVHNVSIALSLLFCIHYKDLWKPDNQGRCKQ
jgi:hypothetical protein